MQILITGGAGFIGCNLAARGIREGHAVTILDNLSRAGSSLNLEWLRSLGKFDFVETDIRDFDTLSNLLNIHKYDAVFHDSAQVAVTTSVEDPRTDFEINALGTFNLLEAIRLSGGDPVLIYASTNKVYGEIPSLNIGEKNGRYSFLDQPGGVPETTPLDFHSPYGCSKGAAEQYVLDYRRIYGLRTIVFRQSCIYGPRQMGVEDQGWVAWFAICASFGRSISIFGDGKQVRDLLYIDDLVDLHYHAIEMEPELDMFAFNVGGGPGCAASLLEVITLIEEKTDRPIELNFADWRPGDQKIYISDIGALKENLSWSPRVPLSDGMGHLLDWIGENREMLKENIG